MLVGEDEIITTVSETVTEILPDTVSEIITENSESDYIYSQVSELNENVSVISDSTAEISQHLQIQTILLFAVICVIGVACGLLGALTWRSK